VLGVALGLSASVQAGAPCTVHVTVAPETVPINGTFKVTAFGDSSNTSDLKLFLTRAHACALTAAGDDAIAGDTLVLTKMVTGAYTIPSTFVGGIEGRHRACAYLTALPPATLARARAAAATPSGSARARRIRHAAQGRAAAPARLRAPPARRRCSSGPAAVLLRPGGGGPPGGKTSPPLGSSRRAPVPVRCCAWDAG